MSIPANRLRRLLIDFATPPRPAVDAGMGKLLDQATVADIEFEGERVRTYAWGEGPDTALFVHGWGSRAADLAAFIRPVVRAGWRVLSFDAPAHGGSSGTTTSIPQISRLIMQLSRTHGGFRAMLGHSIGAAAVAFATAPTSPVLPQAERPHPDRLVLLALPASLAQMTAQYAARIGLSGDERAAFEQAVEEQYGIAVDDYGVARIAPSLDVPVLLLHDAADAEAPIALAREAAIAMPAARMLETQGLGHAGILTSREVIRETAAFVTVS